MGEGLEERGPVAFRSAIRGSTLALTTVVFTELLHPMLALNGGFGSADGASRSDVIGNLLPVIRPEISTAKGIPLIFASVDESYGGVVGPTGRREQSEAAKVAIVRVGGPSRSGGSQGKGAKDVPGGNSEGQGAVIAAGQGGEGGEKKERRKKKEERRKKKERKEKKKKKKEKKKNKRERERNTILPQIFCIT